jgi:hypothetical protein
MADRPSGSPAAPPRRPRYEVGKSDALSVVLGVDDDGATPLGSPTRIEAVILGALGEAGEPLSVDEIARKTQLDFMPLSRGLVDLRRRGDITLQGSPGNEVVSLRSASA